MPRTRLNFTNAEGQQLAGLLEVPEGADDRTPYALFAHCFTCGKDIAAASRISRALANQGIAVLRFDFTGLGSSDGDFANTNFSSNVQDLLAAAQKLADDHQAPSLLIGHSLGGAAVLSAAHELPSIQAVATIASPATAHHVQHLFADATADIQRDGEAKVRIGAREFTIKSQLLSDLENNASTDRIGQLRRPLLVFHSPTDNIVSIDEAARIYGAAKHPKSFISLDNADHLISKRDDADYIGQTIAAWASRYLDIPAQPAAAPAARPSVAEGEVLITELNKKFLRGMYTRDHDLIADEPENYGGGNAGPTPYDLLLMALGACTSMTLRMYANRKKMPLDDVDVTLIHERIHAEDCAECEGRSGQVERMTRYLEVKGDLSQEQRDSLLRIADRCPVHRTLESDPVIKTVLK